MPLDMFQQSQSDWASDQANPSQASLPAKFSETFGAAWNENRFFGQSIAHLNARGSALNDYTDDITRRTGERFDDMPSDLTPPERLAAINDKVAKLNVANPEFTIPPMTDDELDRRAIAKSQMARSDFQEMQAREKTGGGSFGSFLGGAAGTMTDPVNLVVAPLAAPEGLGLLATALAWAGIAGGTQTAIEMTGAPYREMVQPGYGESGEPTRNILGAAAFGGATGGALKGLGMAWSRAKTGTWPRSIRDAGNVAESEANVAQTNVLPGIEGEVAHREALARTIDDIVAGRKVEVPDETLAPHDARLDALMGERAGARGAAEAEAARPTEPAPQLPLEAGPQEVHQATIADGVQGMARQAGYDMAREEAERVAQMVAKASTDEQARAILSTVADRPQTVAEFPPSPLPKERGAEPLAAIEPKAVDQMIGSPEHEAALRADIDRARAQGDVKIPAGVDEKGEPIMRSVDGAMDEIDAYKKAAEQIKACANPQPEPAEAT